MSEPIATRADEKAAEIVQSIAAALQNVEGAENQRLALEGAIDASFRAMRPGFSGETLEKPGEKAAVAGEALATQLGTRYRTDGQTNAYLFARGSESASGPVFYRDGKSGEVMVLMERPKRNNSQWEFPAGFRNALNETQSLTAQEKPQSNHVEPTQENLKRMFTQELSAMQSAEKSAQEIAETFESPAHLQEMFSKHGIHWQSFNDANVKNTFRREMFEETGLELTDGQIHHVKSLTAVNQAAGGDRNNHTDHLHFAELGTLHEAPALKIDPVEVDEARWINLSDINRDKHGVYTIADVSEGKNQLRPELGYRLELALQAYADRQIKHASEIAVAGGKVSEFDSIRDVVAEVRIEAAKQKPANTSALQNFLGYTQMQEEDYVAVSLVGADGQRRIDTLMHTARGLANDKPLAELFPNKLGEQLPAAPELDQQGYLTPSTLLQTVRDNVRSVTGIAI